MWTGRKYQPVRVKMASLQVSMYCALHARLQQGRLGTTINGANLIRPHHTRHNSRLANGFFTARATLDWQALWWAHGVINLPLPLPLSDLLWIFRIYDVQDNLYDSHLHALWLERCARGAKTIILVYYEETVFCDKMQLAAVNVPRTFNWVSLLLNLPSKTELHCSPLHSTSGNWHAWHWMHWR